MRHNDFGTGFGPPSTVESGGKGGTPSLAIDSFGAFHVAYLDVTNNQLRYATGDGSTWTAEIADAGDPAQPIVGSQASLGYEPSSGYPMVSYHDSSIGSLKFADKQPGSWRNEVVVSGKNDGSHSQITPASSALIAATSASAKLVGYSRNRSLSIIPWLRAVAWTRSMSFRT